MIAVDTTVVIAAASPWHDQHAAARDALGDRPHLPDHCALEVYSSLTRMPDPYRASPADTAAYLSRRFGDRVLQASAATVAELPARLARAGIIGGATYDGLVAAIALDHGATLLSLDRRAELTYRAMGVTYEVLF